MKKKKSNPDKAYILQLPDHIIVDIFCKIPIKRLTQCRCVCKSWLRLLSDPQFTKDLFSRTPTCLLLKGFSPKLGGPKSTAYFLVDLNNNASSPDDVVLKLKAPILQGQGLGVMSRGAVMVGSCNGLLCLYCGWGPRGGYLYLCNPITCESFSLPSPTKFKKEFVEGCALGFGFGFGFTPFSDVYKLVLIGPRKGSDQGEVMVMTVGSGIWRGIGDFGYHFYGTIDGIYLNGALHWIIRSKDSVLICGFDVESECFQELSLPPYSLDLEPTNFILGVLKGWLSITICSGNNVSFWLMKDYGVKESWTRELEISVSSTCRFQVLEFTEEGQILLLLQDGLHIYSPGTRAFSRVEADGIPSMVERASFLIPSFLSFKDVNAGAFHQRLGRPKRTVKAPKYLQDYYKK